jgi:hypothetical protein
MAEIDCSNGEAPDTGLTENGDTITMTEARRSVALNATCEIEQLAAMLLKSTKDGDVDVFAVDAR